jgi:putative transposase
VVSSQAQSSAVNHLRLQHCLSERRACELVGAHRTTHRYQRKKDSDEALRGQIKALAYKRVTFGYRRIHALLKREGIVVNHKKVYRLYREEGLARRRRRGKKLSRSRLSPLTIATRPNEKWSMDFMSDSTADGRKFRVLNILDIFTRESLAIEVRRSFPSSAVIESLEKIAEERGFPEAIRMDNGPEYVSVAMLDWSQRRGVFLDYTTPGKPTENGHIESFNGKFREECLDQNAFSKLKEAQKIAEEWGAYYNNERPHSALGYKSPKEFAQEYKPVELFTTRSRTIQQDIARSFISSQARNAACELMNNLAQEEEENFAISTKK